MPDSQISQKRNLSLIIGPILILAIVVCVNLVNKGSISTEDASVQMRTVTISPEISGVVSLISAKNNQHVTANTPLFSIENHELIIHLAQAEAEVTNRLHSLTSLKQNYLQLLAELNNAAEQEDAILKAQLAQHVALLDGNPYLKPTEYSSYLQAKAKLDQINLDLERTVIKAPFDGITANFYLEKGTYVSKGMPLLSIIDDQNLWIEANFKETEVSQIHPGQKATVTLDLYPSKKLEAIVESITPATGSSFSILPAENSSGNWVKVTQRVMVKLLLANYHHEFPLYAGASASVTIQTKATK